MKPASVFVAEEYLDPTSPCGLNIEKINARQELERERGNGNDISTRILLLQVNKGKIGKLLQSLRTIRLEREDFGKEMDINQASELALNLQIQGLQIITAKYTREILQTFPMLKAEQVAKIPSRAGYVSLSHIVLPPVEKCKEDTKIEETKIQMEEAR